MQTELTILKIGGKLIEDDRVLNEVLSLFSKMAGPKILVHGGGKEAGILSEQLGIPVQMTQGRRITDADTLKVVTMVYAGLINKKLVSQLQALGAYNAIGLSGADGNSILAHKRLVKDIDYGFAGDIDAVNTGLLSKLLELGLIPVFCALTHDGKGQLLNTNADTIATELAIALVNSFSVKVFYCFDKPGVLDNPEDDKSVRSRLDRVTFEHLKSQGAIHTGMLPKLDNAFRALEDGVREVVIGGVQALAGTQMGTRIVLE